MARERILSGESQGVEEDLSALSLRPTHLDEMIGQDQVIEQLRIAISAARQRREPLEHVLLDGPPGLGKTTLAHVIANEMSGCAIRVTSGPVLCKTADLMSLLTTLDTGEVLFIDEVHRLPKPVEEFMYPAMEDFRVDYTLEGGVGGRNINFPLKRYTLVGATTRSGLLSAAMRDRFGLTFHLEFYDRESLTEILRRSAGKLDINAEADALAAIAQRSRGTPRVANRLLRRARDYAQFKSRPVLDLPTVEQGLEIQRVDSLGLDDLDRSFLRSLIEIYGGGPAGIEAIAASLGQERDTLEDVVEPYLLQLGFVIRTRQGRQATPRAYEHLGLEIPEMPGPPGVEATLF